MPLVCTEYVLVCTVFVPVCPLWLWQLDVASLDTSARQDAARKVLSKCLKETRVGQKVHFPDGK
jgi:hypothetical protein